MKNKQELSDERQRIVESNNYAIKAGRVETQQDLATLEELQRWNKEHPEMKIVAGEHGYV